MSQSAHRCGEVVTPRAFHEFWVDVTIKFGIADVFLLDRIAATWTAVTFLLGRRSHNAARILLKRSLSVVSISRINACVASGVGL